MPQRPRSSTYTHRSHAPTLVACALAALLVVLLAAPPLALAQPRPPAPAPAAVDPVHLAQQQYEDLKYEESIQTLTGALVRPNNTKEQKVQIYRMLFIDFVTLNRPGDADNAARNLLALEPGFELARGESPRFRDFFGTSKKKWEDEGRPGLVREAEPPPVPITMQHASPSQADSGNEVPLLCRIEDPQKRVTFVKLYYRTGTQGSFTEVQASFDGQAARVNIPPSAVRPPFVEYYLIGYAGQNPVASRGDAIAPLRVAVPEPKRGWVLPVAIVGAIVLVGGGLGIAAAAGAFKGSGGGGSTHPSTVGFTFQ